MDFFEKCVVSCVQKKDWKIFATYITKAAIKNIQWAIVFCCLHIFNVILHFHFNTVSFIIFTAFKFLIAIFFHQSWHRPFFIGFPIRLQILKWLQRKIEKIKKNFSKNPWHWKLRHIFFLSNGIMFTCMPSITTGLFNFSKRSINSSQLTSFALIRSTLSSNFQNGSKRFAKSNAVHAPLSPNSIIESKSQFYFSHSW